MSGGDPAALDQWLALAEPEPVLLPDLPITDPHHHLWDRGGHRYLREALLADLTAGHRIERTLYVECQSAYHAVGPAALRPVGETAFALAHGAPVAGDGYMIRPCAGIIAFADLGLGGAVEPVIDAHRAKADGRLRGIRYATAWHDGSGLRSAYPATPGMLARADVREGLGVLARAGLRYDAWVYFTQLGDVAAMADACPDLTIILDHLGAPIGIGPWRESRAEVFAVWRAALADVAARPNVVVKLGGLGMALAGFPFRKQNVPPSSLALSGAWHPYIDTAIDLFGVDRAMFESNYPVDRSSGSYSTLWNAFKRSVPGASMTEKATLFAGTANRIYDLF